MHVSKLRLIRFDPALILLSVDCEDNDYDDISAKIFGQEDGYLRDFILRNKR